MPSKNKNALIKRILAITAVSIILVCAFAVPISGAYGYYGTYTTDPLLFYPQIAIAEITTNPTTTFLQPCLTHYKYSSSNTGWYPTVEGTINTNYYISDEETGVFDWHYMTVWRVQNNKAQVRTRVANSATSNPIYKINLYQDVIYIPFNWDAEGTSVIDNPWMKAWTDFTVQLWTASDSVDTTITTANASFDICIAQLDTTTYEGGDRVETKDVKLMTVTHTLEDDNFVGDVYMPFTVPLYNEVKDNITTNQEVNSKSGTGWLAIRNFELDMQVSVNSTITPINSRVYIDVKQPTTLDLSNGTYYLYKFNPEDYYTPLSVYADLSGGESGGVVPPTTAVPDMIEWLINTIDGVMSVDLFMGLSIGQLLWFIIGISLLFVCIKLFTGG